MRRFLIGALALLAGLAFAAPASGQLTLADFVVPAGRHVARYMLMEVDVVTQNATLEHLWCAVGETRGGCPGTGTVIDGSMELTTFEGAAVNMTWFRRRMGTPSQFRFNVPNLSSSLSLATIFGGSGELSGSWFHLQTDDGVADTSAPSIGRLFVNMEGAIYDLAAMLETGDRMLFVITREGPGPEPPPATPCSLFEGASTLTAYLGTDLLSVYNGETLICGPGN